MRDGRCVISGIANSGVENGVVSKQHIFSHWKRKTQCGFREIMDGGITDMDDMNGVSKINSLQYGFLLMSNVHQQFDKYLVSINSDVSASSIE